MNLSMESSPFYVWLRRQSTRDDVIGDFAKDAVEDWRFPAGANLCEEVDTFLRHRMWYGGYHEASVVLEEVWAEFEAYKNARKSIGLTLRFAILKRDGYRCRLCGRAAPDVTLEVDHTVAVANGGTSDESNLMTLCFDCNRGKRTNDL